MSEQDLEHLYSNERLTDNLTDDLASMLLKWGERQIQAGITSTQVQQAVRAANLSNATNAESLLKIAEQALHQGQHQTTKLVTFEPPTIAAKSTQARPISPVRRRHRLVFRCSRKHG